ncbi:MAG: mechanosensitive ion channel family protein, partial [Myxococcota bacterium]
NRYIALSDILVLIVVVAVTFWGTGVVTKITLRALGERGVDTSGTVGVLLSLGRYVLIVVGLGVALNTIGIDLTALFTLGAVFAVTIGFALQNISQNFISGIILLVEGAIRPGDILEVEGRVVRVIKLGVRSTVARSMDDEDLILPNATLAQGTVKNLTMIDDELRIRASVSVAYESDLEQIEKILMTAARSVADPKAIRTPIVLLEEFADSGIHFDAFIWISDPWMAPKMRSKLRMAIWKAFKAHGVVIPFPQVDVHVERPSEVQH